MPFKTASCALAILALSGLTPALAQPDAGLAVTGSSRSTPSATTQGPTSNNVGSDGWGDVYGPSAAGDTRSALNQTYPYGSPSPLLDNSPTNGRANSDVGKSDTSPPAGGANDR